MAPQLSRLSPPPAPHTHFLPPAAAELDFCSRPILDERGKKVWEVLVCDPQRDFEFAQYFPNNKINSAEVGAGGCRVLYIGAGL